MPPFGPALGEQGVKDVTHYVMSLSERTHDSLRRARGEALFKSTCSACHGADGKGNAALGAPNLSDRTWLHGSAESAIVETVTRGRTNHMPAHKELLDEAKIHLLTAYVLSLSRQPAP
jgi:cytochrome c oxidase cbb3-type subunit 3